MTEPSPTPFEPLRSVDVGLRVIRAGTVRLAGYGVGTVITAATSVFLLRYLGVANFGRYMTVISLVAIVGGLTDAGISAIGTRNLAIRRVGPERAALLGNLLGLRLALTPLGVVVVLAFAVGVGYDRTLLVGTVLAGIGLALTSYQSTLAVPLSVDMRNGILTTLDLLKQVTMLAAIATLVVVRAGLTPFFAVAVVVGVVALPVTAATVGDGYASLPRFDVREWRPLIRDVIPLAVAAAIGVLYFRLLIILTSLLASARATGLFSVSFRVTEVLLSISSLLLTVILPVLAVAAEDRQRLRYITQRLVEVAAMTATLLVILVFVAAAPVLELLGGHQYRAAAPVLRVEVFALVPMFLGQTFAVVLVAIHRQARAVIASSIALTLALGLGFVLIPVYGATGAAIAAVGAETGLTIAAAALVIVSDRSLTPRVSFAWKIAVAVGAAVLIAQLGGLPIGARLPVIAVGYLLALWATGAIPTEISDALRGWMRRRPDVA